LSIFNNDEELASLLSRIETENFDSFLHSLLESSPLVPVYVWTINLSHLREYLTSNLILNFSENNCLLVADGWPVRFLARVIANREVNRITGVDLVEALISRVNCFCVLGSTHIQVDASMRRLPISYPPAKYLVHDGSINLESESQILNIASSIKRSGAKYFFIALGFPKQELLFDKLRKVQNLNPGFYFGIGGSFQMLSGQKRRAPKAIQSLNLEWFWRLCQDPKRLIGRYAMDSLFLAQLMLGHYLVVIRRNLIPWST
jgi:N-acetylglucosaminyldiphosphoundecaprenol N-acetyl-beta-D-mannosaminyltransferase